MELKLPLVVAPRGQGLVAAWVPLPATPHVRGEGPSLAALRDDLALMVMESFSHTRVDELGAWQLPPHVRLEMVKLDVVAQDRARKRKLPLVGRIGVLVEKWPMDDFHVVTPTRLPSARFALARESDLEAALAKRLVQLALDGKLDSLEELHAERRERLEVLEVDADPPSILPTAPPPERPRMAKQRDGSAAETLEAREERRRRRRVSVVALRECARNLTHGARDDLLERAFAREPLVRHVVDELEGREGLAILLVGPPGAGKTAIVHEVVRRLVARQTSQSRRDVWRIDGNRFIAGMSFVGQWEERARRLVDELADLGDILYVDDLASILYAGRTRNEDTNLAQFLEPHLARGELTVLAESTPERFARVREEAPTFASLFRVVHVPPLDDRETLPVLLGVLRELESHSTARLTPQAIEKVLHVARRFLPQEAFPGKGVRVLRSVVATAASSGATGLIDVDAVYTAVGRQTGLPPFILGAEEPRTREDITRELAGMVAGQPDAVAAVADVIIAMQHALSDPDKPLATYLFVGPTGVGKTETAKALARFLFGSPQRLVRFDMSELSSPYSLSRLVGEVGGAEGELTLALRTQPFSVVLFDEIEKAHPLVFDALLQLLGEGRLTDAMGRTADARQAVILMTSNLGVREAATRIGYSRDAAALQAHYVAAVREFFRPEFFNRIDRIVAFAPLGPSALRVIVEHALGDLLSRRGIRRGNVLVDVEPELLDLLVEQAYDPRYGARPLRRALERRLAVPLAHHLVRRRSDDRTVVELFARGGDMALAVRALGDAPALGPVDDPATWSAREVRERFGRVRDRLAEIEQSAWVTAARAGRAELLAAAGGDGRDASSIDLVERLTELVDEARRLEEGALAEAHYVEESIDEASQDLREHGKGYADHTRYRGGLRPREGFIERPLVGVADALARSARADVAALADAVAILSDQIAAAPSGEERCTLLLEPVTPLEDIETLGLLRRAVPTRHLHARWLVDEGGRWKEPDRSEPEQFWGRRACVALRGPGARRLVAHLVGHAIVEQHAGGEPHEMLVRIALLDGDDALAAVTEDARARAQRRRGRREGEAIADGETLAAVTLRFTARHGLVHVATGQPLDSERAGDAILARALASRGA